MCLLTSITSPSVFGFDFLITLSTILIGLELTSSKDFTRTGAKKLAVHPAHPQSTGPKIDSSLFYLHGASRCLYWHYE